MLVLIEEGIRIWAALLMRTCMQQAAHRHHMSVMPPQLNVRVPLATPTQVRGSSSSDGERRGFTHTLI